MANHLKKSSIYNQRNATRAEIILPFQKNSRMSISITKRKSFLQIKSAQTFHSLVRAIAIPKRRWSSPKSSVNKEMRRFTIISCKTHVMKSNKSSQSVGTMDLMINTSPMKTNASCIKRVEEAKKWSRPLSESHTTTFSPFNL